MRLAEKTLELTFCHQVGSHLMFSHHGAFSSRWPWRHDVIWFGLTQRQEARLGFDMAARIGGRIVILQFKASEHVLRSGHRRFVAPHDQMTALQKICRGTRAVYYVLPNLGTSHDVATNPCVVPQCWFLNVHSLPQPLPLPTTAPRGTGVRKSRSHYVDLDAGNSQVTIHSEPLRLPVKAASDWFNDVLAGPKEEVGMEPLAITEAIDDLSFERGAVGAIIHDREERS